MTEQVKRKRGRPAFVATDEQRSAVNALAAAGFSHERIARTLKIGKETLEKNFRDELETASALMTGTAVGKLYEAIKKGQAWAICFYLKTKCKDLGFSERQEVTGANGGPVQNQTLVIDPEKLKGMTDDELAALERAIGKLQGSAGGDQGGEGAPGEGTPGA